MQAEDLKPQGVLHHACITAPAEGEEFQEQLPEAVRRQYLHELFPDLSLEANFQDEPDHQELIVPREDIGPRLYTGDSSLHTDYTRCDLAHALKAVCIGFGCYSCKSRQYLHEFFPDLSNESNLQDEPDHQELLVPRELANACTQATPLFMQTTPGVICCMPCKLCALVLAAIVASQAIHA